MCSSFISVNNFYRNDGSNEKQTVKQKLKHEKKISHNAITSTNV